MSTIIDLGPVLSIPKGEWDKDTTYELLNIVRHNSASWICRAKTSLGEEPSETSSDWYLQVKDTSAVASVNGMRGDVIIDSIATPEALDDSEHIANTLWVRDRLDELEVSVKQYSDTSISTAASSTLEEANNTSKAMVDTLAATASATYAVKDSLAAVATSGSYASLTDTPSALPNPASLVLKNSSNADIGSYNGSGAVTVQFTAATVGLSNVTNESKSTMFTSPAFTGTPSAPTAANGTNTTQIATTAFVKNAVDAKTSIANATKATQDASGNVITSTYATKTELNALIPAGTKMLFHQAAAPTGWTKQTSVNNAALRVVSGNGGGTGGSIDFSTLFAAGKAVSLSGNVGATTLSVAQMPSHNHSVEHTQSYYYNTKGINCIHTTGFRDDGTVEEQYKDGAKNTIVLKTGSSNSHTHSLSGSASISLAVKYADVIICSKN